MGDRKYVDWSPAPFLICSTRKSPFCVEIAICEWFELSELFQSFSFRDPLLLFDCDVFWLWPCCCCWAAYGKLKLNSIIARPPSNEIEFEISWWKCYLCRGGLWATRQTAELIFASHRRIPMIFDGIVRSTGQQFGNFRPLIAPLFVRLINNFILIFGPCSFLDIRIQMIVPSFAALFSNATP